MADVLTPEQRRLNMSRVRGKNTRPELILRRGLHARGLRFRLHQQNLPGRPDLVFPKYQVCIFVHGCFWHGHNCPLFKLPSTRQQFWKEKIAQNKKRDQKSVTTLLETGWRVLILWECAVRGSLRRSTEQVLDECVNFITLTSRNRSDNKQAKQIKGINISTKNR